MSQLIYIETSIASFYHETRAGQFQTMREWTREWWDIARVRDELVTAEPVLTELKRSPAPKRSLALTLVELLPLLDDVEVVDELVAVYFEHKLMPRDEAEAERIVAEGVKRLKLTAKELRNTPGSEPRKVAIASAVHGRTAVTRHWTAQRLGMKSAVNVTQQIKRWKAEKLKPSREVSQWLSTIAP